MEDCTKTSKRIAETVEVEAAPSSMILTPKRTKCSLPPPPQLKKSPSTDNSTPNNLIVQTMSSAFLSDSLSSSRYSNSDSLEAVKDSAASADLKVEEGAASSYKGNDGNSMEAPFSGDSERTLYMDSPEKIPPPDSPPRNSSAAAQMPSLAEIDEFFSEAEKREQKRFAEKYNFDVAKEVPMEGRYKWERVKP